MITKIRNIVAVFAGSSCMILLASTHASAVTFSYSKSFGTLANGNGQFVNPFGVAVDNSENVYVADTYNNRIDRFNPNNFNGTFTSFGTLGNGNGQFDNPGGVAVDNSGNVYVGDTNNNRIDRFNFSNPNTTFTSFGTFGNGNGQFIDPQGVATNVRRER